MSQAANKQETNAKRRRKKRLPAKAHARVSFCLLDKDAEAVLAAAFLALGGVRKAGCPPRGVLEREARGLLDKFEKGKQKE